MTERPSFFGVKLQFTSLPPQKHGERRGMSALFDALDALPVYQGFGPPVSSVSNAPILF
jgi:hypothetical protein